jgi:hypothetical protein
MYMYYLLGYKILGNSEIPHDALDQDTEAFESTSGVLKKVDLPAGHSRAKLTSSELRRRRAAAHFTRSVIFNYVPEQVQNQVTRNAILTPIFE